MNNTNQTKQQTTLAIFDILKFILALGVVAIHTRFLEHQLYPWLRMTVPLFFLMSAYFLFLKLTRLQGDVQKQNATVKNFIIRNLTLYAFWFIALLPMTLKIRQYFANGFVHGVITFIRTFLFDSTFVASWFIMATVIGTILVFLASKKLNSYALLFLTMMIYILTALRSSYYSEFQNIPLIYKSVNLYESVFYPAYNSFPAAMYWVACGKCFAEGKINLKLKWSIPLTIISAGLLYAEWVFVKGLNGSYNNDCYIFLIPLCTFVFAIIKEIPPLRISNTVYLRKASVIMFAFHGNWVSLMMSTKLFFPYLEWLQIPASAKNFITTVAVGLLLTTVILVLEKKKGFTWLKYSH